MSTARPAVHMRCDRTPRRGVATRATPCASSLFFSPTRRAHRHLGRPEPGEDAVLVVEFGTLHEGRKVLRVTEILGREARHDLAREREELRVLRDDHLGQQALHRVPGHVRIVVAAGRGGKLAGG